MSRQPLEFTAQSALEALERFGWHHVSKSTPRSLLDPFMEAHGLVLEEGAAFTVTLVLSGQKGSKTDWERIRLERQLKREKAAVAKKKKEQA